MCERLHVAEQVRKGKRRAVVASRWRVEDRVYAGNKARLLSKTPQSEGSTGGGKDTVNRKDQS